MIACISAAGQSVPPLLIYKGSNHELQASWLSHVNKDSNTYFSSTENGWSSNEMGLLWLQKIFDRHTKPISSRETRLLIVDGHASYVNWAFIQWAS